MIVIINQLTNFIELYKGSMKFIVLQMWWSAIRVASQESLKGILQKWWSAIRVAFWRHFWLYTRMMYISEIDDRNLYVICISTFVLV
jgi:hypothetical protein